MMSVLMLYPLGVHCRRMALDFCLRLVYVALLSYSLIALTTVLLYVIACDPLPPCVGRVQVWLSGLAGQRLPAQESPVPVPDSSGLSASCHRSA